MRKKRAKDPICATDILRALYLMREDELKRYDLTKKEIVVAQHILDGVGNADIAKRLRLSVSGVKYHVSNILLKTRRRSREELCRLVRLAVASSDRTWKSTAEIEKDAEGRIMPPTPRSGEQG